MRALFEIRGKVLYAETDATLPHDTIKVHSLDAFASMLDSLDAEAENFVVHGKNGTKPLVHRPRRKAASNAVIPEVDASICPPAPEGGWRDGNGHAIILGNFGVNREQVAVAMQNVRAGKLTEDEVKLLSLRFGIGNPKAKPHSTTEIAQMHDFGEGTTGQSVVSSRVKGALRRLGLRPKSYRHRKG